MANAVTVSGTLLTPDAPSNPDLCRVSGYIRDIHGDPLKAAVLTIRHKYDPIAVGQDTLVINERQEAKTDANGLVTFDLYQGAEVEIEIPNLGNTLVRTVTVPEQSTIDLIALILPHLVSAAFDDSDPVALVVDERKTFSVTGTFSDGTTDDITAACTLTSADEAVASKVMGAQFVGIAAGSTTISLDSIDQDKLETNEDPAGDIIQRLDIPTPTLPSDITVNVS